MPSFSAQNDAAQALRAELLSRAGANVLMASLTYNSIIHLHRGNGKQWYHDER